MKNKLYSHFYIIVLFICFPNYCSSQDIIKTYSDNGGINQVYVLKAKDWVNLTKFPNPNHIYDFDLSNDKGLAFVYHMDYPPAQLTVYDAENLQQLYSFKPRVRGSFSWSKTNRIILEYGAGTSRCISIFHINGSLIYRGYKNSDLWEASYISVNPSKEYIVRLPEYQHFPGYIEIIRIDDGKIWINKTEKIVAWDYSWKSESILEIILNEDGDAGKVLTVDVYKFVSEHRYDKNYIFAE